MWPEAFTNKTFQFIEKAHGQMENLGLSGIIWDIELFVDKIDPDTFIRETTKRQFTHVYVFQMPGNVDYIT